MYPQTLPENNSALMERFYLWTEVELRHSSQSVSKYRDCMTQWEKRTMGRNLTELSMPDLFAAKKEWLRRGLSVSRQASLLLTLKLFLRHCAEHQVPTALNLADVSAPKRPTREVSYLTPEELERVFDAIPLRNADGSVRATGLRLRALIEVLLGSAMRIGELLSLNIVDLDLKQKEARVIGKGNKQRVVFFTDRAIEWLRKYLGIRADAHVALFVCQDGEARLRRDDLWRYFKRVRMEAGLNKAFTPHSLRHTAATLMLFNGCPVGHIKEILGHERLETTCRYYLGLDKRAAKAALATFLRV